MFKRQSGQMGSGVNLWNVLTLTACPSGLRLEIMRLLGPYQRPFLVPWAQISVAPRRAFFIDCMRLSLGQPEIGSLTIDARLWRDIAARHIG